MSEIEEFCCGKCLYYNGDMRDKKAFCDEREDYVSKNYYCYRYEEGDLEEQSRDRMRDYFHESMVAKMIAGTDYQQGYSVGFDSGYKQGREEAFDEFVAKYKEFIELVCAKEEFCYGDCMDCFVKWYKEQKNG